jgi:hypothetical protein
MTTSAPLTDPDMTAALGDDGIVRLTWARGIVITGEVAERSVVLVKSVSAGRERPLMVDMNDVKTITREGRNVYEDVGTMTALALVGSSPVVRVLANFALSINHPGVPTRFCTSAAEAETFLRDYLR